MPLRRDQYIGACALEVLRTHDAAALQFVAGRLEHARSRGDAGQVELWRDISRVVARTPDASGPGFGGRA